MSALASYADQRDELNAQLASQMPMELLTGFGAGAARVDAIDFGARAPKVGDPAPGFSLNDQTGEQVSLDGLLSEGPVVVIFYRGEWCPYCNLQLRTFQGSLDQFARHGARLVAISPQTPDNSLSMAEKHALGFSVMSDPDASAIDAYGLRWELDDELRQLFTTAGIDLGQFNADAQWSLPAAATFVIGRDRRVQYVNIHGDWTQRAEPADVLEVLSRQ